MGHNAFRAHVKDIQNTTDEEERRKLIRHRFRESLLEATPYCLRLRQDGCSTVLDLVKYNLPDLMLPPALQARYNPYPLPNISTVTFSILLLPTSPYFTYPYLPSGTSRVLVVCCGRPRHHRQDLSHQERHPADGQGIVFRPSHV